MKTPTKKPESIKEDSGFKKFFNKFSKKVTKGTGSPFAFLVAVLAVIIWACTGPIFHYSDTWQLIINTSTTIITFLMVFVIQQSQNKESIAIQLKLNELIAANKFTSNRLVDVEELSDEELQKMSDYYLNLSKKVKNEIEVHTAASIDKKIENQEDELMKKNKEK